jgi:ATP-dependent Lon protease
MTGEITLRGRILPVGGVREKVLAAHRAGLKTVLIPKRNVKDLTEIPKRARRELNILNIEHMDEVLELALTPEKVAKQPLSKRGASTGKKSSKSTKEVPIKPGSDTSHIQPGA